MAQYWKFYLPEYHPTGLDTQVGGGIGSIELEPELGFLFSHMETNGLEQVQYRKLFAKQIVEADFVDVSIEIGNVEHTGQVSFYISDLTGVATNAETLPDGVIDSNFSGDWESAITGLATSSLGSSMGIWFKETLPANEGSDVLGSFTVQIKAIRN